MAGYSDALSGYQAPGLGLESLIGRNTFDISNYNTPPYAPTTVGMPGVGGAVTVDPISKALERYSMNAGQFGTRDYINAGLAGVQTIGGLIGAFSSLDLAKKQYKLGKRMAETNLTNSVQAYNTALDDKARSRAVMEGQSDSERDAYIASHRATTGR